MTPSLAAVVSRNVLELTARGTVASASDTAGGDLDTIWSQEVAMTVDKEINVVGKACPIPLIALAKEVRGMDKGQVVRIVGNDPIFEPSIVDCCRERGFTILETTRDGRTVSIIFAL